MTITCPHCAAVYHAPGGVAGASGTMVECPRCGTRWRARLYADDPWRRRDFPRIAEPADVSEAIVIDHVPPPSAPRHEAPRRAAPARLSGFAGLGWRKAAAALAGGAVALILLGAPIMAALPDASAAGLPADLDQLEFRRVRSETVQHRGVRTLFVEGEIVNRSGNDVALPAVRISLRAANGSEVYSWLVEPSANGLAAGRSIAFRSAVGAPPPDASQVTLKLAAREGRTVGTH